MHEHILRGLTIATLLLSGCAHNYVYTGTLAAEDSQGKQRQFLLYWNRTERPIWFDTAEGTVRVLPQCSLNVMPYDERPEGIIFRARDTDKKVIDPERDQQVCGRILSGNVVTDLPDDSLSLTVLCADSPVDELNQPKPYLKARPEPYTFNISRLEVPDFTAIPKRPQCTDSR
jgi:hypothetical protein